MKKILVAFAACTAMFTATPAQDLPKLSEFLMSCSRDQMQCSQKIKNYIEASQNQKIICLPQDVSVREAAYDTLRWLRDSDNVSAAMHDGPFDDALFEATTKLYPCKTEAAPQPPVPPPATEPSAAPPSQP